MKAHFIMSVQRHCRNKISHVPKPVKVPVWDEKEEAVRSEARLIAWEKNLYKRTWTWNCKF